MKTDSLNTLKLKTQMRQVMDVCFWAGSNYWSTRSPSLKIDPSKTNIKICYLAKSECFGFIFNKFHSLAVEVFRKQPSTQRWFYTEPVNCFKSFSAWCISEPCFESVMVQLHGLPDIELEFIFAGSKEGLCLPAPFEEWGLEFYEVGAELC